MIRIHALALLLFAAFLALPAAAVSQKQFMGQYRLDQIATGSSLLPPSNSVSHVVNGGATLWIGTSKGVGRSGTLGRDWQSLRSNPAFASDGIFAISVLDSSVWVATGYDKQIGDGSVQTGSGYAASTDGGTSWTHIAQAMDQRGDSTLAYGINDSIWILPVVVPEQNVTFDVAQSPGTVWIASWASGLRKSTDNGASWHRTLLPTDDRSSLRPTDTLWTYAPSDTLRHRRIFRRVDPRRNNNLLAFSVLAVGQDTVWCGTAGGVNRSTDGGTSWVRFTHTNQASPILGNWVIAVDIQRFSASHRIWTTNWKAEDQSEDFGVSYTDDDGRIWKSMLRGVRAYDFAFKDSIAYIATDDGIYRTENGGDNFEKISEFADPGTHQSIASSKVFSVEVVGDTVLIGTEDGMASTVDDGSQPFGAAWKIYRAYAPSAAGGGSYAYPNPFSPTQEPVRIHYGWSGASERSVTIDIFDFGMNRVRTLVQHAVRSGAGEFDEVWDGKNDEGRIAANGVYIYRVQLDNEDAMYGKILVLQ